MVAGLLAGALIAAVVSQRAELLVRPWFTWVLVGTAMLLAAVAVRTKPVITPGAAGALLLPVAIGLTLTPSLASRATEDATLSTVPASRIGDGSNPLVNGRGGPVTLLQILQAEQQVGAVLLAGRTVQVDAIVGGPHRLDRSVIVCCAADAQRITVAEQGPLLSPAGHWVRVIGRLGAAGTRTVIVVTSVRPIPTPADPFL
jgi:hypothetical protein